MKELVLYLRLNYSCKIWTKNHWCTFRFVCHKTRIFISWGTETQSSHWCCQT